MCACLLWCETPFAEEKLTIGVAANFMLPFEKIAHEFEIKTHIEIDAVYTSTGNLYGQIINGAPFDLFLAADEKRPERLFQEGLVLKPFVYAQGRAVLWSADKQVCKAGDWQRALMHPRVKRVSIANPENAPYGAAASNALRATGLEAAIVKKLVFAQNVVQSFQYAHTQTVDAGFCALSAVFTEQGRRGCYFIIEQAPAIVQKACILKSSKNRSLVEKFTVFLGSEETQSIKIKFGYR